MKKGVLVTAGIVLFVGFLLYLSLGLRKHRVEVCMTFRGQTNCRTAAAGSREEALRIAVQNACATISSGMTESMACERTPPTSVTWR